MDKSDIAFASEPADAEVLVEPGLIAVSGPANENAPLWHPSSPSAPDNQTPDSETTRPVKGTFLDETLSIRDPEGQSFAMAVTQLIAAHRDLRRQRHAVEIENEANLVRCILANGLRCRWYRNPAVVAYQRKADGYSHSLTKPQWLSGRALSRAVDLLAKASLVGTQVGEREISSGYTVTEELLALTEAHGVTDQSLVRSLQREDLVQLKSAKPRATFDRWTRTLVRRRADRIHFAATAETEGWRNTLAAYNAFLAEQDIRIEPPAELTEEWVANLNDASREAVQLFRPELFRTALYRVFNDGTAEQAAFDKGGRLVGAWWINAPKEVRAHITIDGEPTVELDYSACHPRMLYHELGLEAPDDPYDIPEIADLERHSQLKTGHYRPAVKWLTQVLLNGRGRPDLVPVPERISIPPGIPVRDLAAMIERHHAPVAASFQTRAGLRLMKIESDIALSIIAKAIKKGRIVLPVHDSFIATTTFCENLRIMMKEEYKEVIGMDPVIN